MNSPFRVLTVPKFERLARRLLKSHPEFTDRYAEALDILRNDPHNRGRKHDVKKLVGLPSGSGQYRLRLGRWRFRYDIFGREVVLSYCGLRREETYG